MSGEQPKAENSPVAERHTVHAASAVITHLFNFQPMRKFKPEYLLDKIVTAGAEMRDAQNDYFRLKTAPVLHYCKKKEVAFDRLLLLAKAEKASEELGGYPVDVAAEVMDEYSECLADQLINDSNTRPGAVMYSQEELECKGCMGPCGVCQPGQNETSTRHGVDARMTRLFDWKGEDDSNTRPGVVL